MTRLNVMILMKYIQGSKMNTLHNMKFRVLSPEHSEEIQRELFRLGYESILNDSNIIKYPEIEYLYTVDGFIKWGNDEDEFFDTNATETTLEELKVM